MAHNNTTIGAFVLGGAGLALLTLVGFGNFHFFSRTQKAVIVFQDAISGLSVGAQVTFRGVRVGAVRSIGLEFDPRVHAAFIPVTVQLEPGKVHIAKDNGADAADLTKLISRGLRAELNIQSFVTGQSEIDLDFDPSSPAILHPDITDAMEIPTRQSAIQKVKDTLSELPLRELSTNANATLENIRTLAEKLDRDLPPLVTSLHETSDQSRQTIVAATKSIEDVQTRLDTTLSSINRLTDAGTAQLKARGQDLHALLLHSDQTMMVAHESLRQLNDLASPRSSDRANIDSTLRDLAAAAAALRSFANDVEHNPQLLLTGRHS